MLTIDHFFWVSDPGKNILFLFMCILLDVLVCSIAVYLYTKSSNKKFIIQLL